MYEIRKEKDNKYRFSLKTKQGSTLLNSIPFSSEEDARSSLEELIPAADRPPRVERATDYNGKFLFKLRNQKGKIVGKSNLFSSEAGMENGIKHLLDQMRKIPSKKGL